MALAIRRAQRLEPRIDRSGLRALVDPAVSRRRGDQDAQHDHNVNRRKVGMEPRHYVDGADLQAPHGRLGERQRLGALKLRRDELLEILPLAVKG